MSPRDGEETLRTEDILKTIEEQVYCTSQTAHWFLSSGRFYRCRFLFRNSVLHGSTLRYWEDYEGWTSKGGHYWRQFGTQLPLSCSLSMVNMISEWAMLNERDACRIVNISEYEIILCWIHTHMRPFVCKSSKSERGLSLSFVKFLWHLNND